MSSASDIQASMMLSSLLHWCKSFSHSAFFVTSNLDFSVAFGSISHIQIDEGQGAFSKLQQFHSKSSGKIVGFLGYDLKNDLEDLVSENKDFLGFPEAYFFQPEGWIHVKDGRIQKDSAQFKTSLEPLENYISTSHPKPPFATINYSTSRDEYLQQVKQIKTHLQRGDIYEMNYCIEFGLDEVFFDPYQHFLRLQTLTEAPMSVFANLNGKFILSASPERFIKNVNGHLISQPIKGTAQRSNSFSKDLKLKKDLAENEKERSENVMIVDLVRNDLSRVAKRRSVEVSELCQPVTFKTVHHLVSTITARLNSPKHNEWDAIKACFPMGSMTGAPKISAMRIIEEHENFKRAAYSGAFGWMNDSGDFDFNVLIRSLFYTRDLRKLTFAVGSAITINSDPEKEYDECMVKAEALLRSLGIYASNESSPSFQ